MSAENGLRVFRTAVGYIVADCFVGDVVPEAQGKVRHVHGCFSSPRDVILWWEENAGEIPVEYPSNPPHPAELEGLSIMAPKELVEILKGGYWRNVVERLITPQIPILRIAARAFEEGGEENTFRGYDEYGQQSDWLEKEVTWTAETIAAVLPRLSGEEEKKLAAVLKGTDSAFVYLGRSAYKEIFRGTSPDEAHPWGSLKKLDREFPDHLLDRVLDRLRKER